MALKNNGSQNAAKTFTVRNITKEFYEPFETETVTLDFHLELGEKNETVIIEDRKRDWCEIANKDVDQVGLENILRLVKKGLVDPSTLMFSDDEEFDTSSIDPMDPNAIKSAVASQAANIEKLNSIAKQLDCTSDALVQSFLDGTFNELVQAKIGKESEVKDNA